MHDQTVQKDGLKADQPFVWLHQKPSKIKLPNNAEIDLVKANLI